MNYSKLHCRLFLLVAGMLAGASIAVASGEGTQPRLNQIQVIGTHNSYAQPPDPRAMAIMAPRLQAIFEGMFTRMSSQEKAKFAEEHPVLLEKGFGASLDYIHPPLEYQLRAGLRSLEIDLYVDREGGRFADPLPYRQLREAGEKDLAPLYDNALREPGLKVLHVADVDFRSHCPTFRICLTQMRQWSEKNPGHSPVFVLLEPKLPGLNRAIPGAAEVDAFTEMDFDEMDSSIQEVLGRKRVFTPDDLRGSAATLEAAALSQDGWPRLDQSRGKFVFLLLVPGENFEALSPYTARRPSLKGRMAFMQGKPGMPHTAFVMVDNHLTDPAVIPSLVKRGYLVRSRADIDTHEALLNATERRDKTLASGAQVISTDFFAQPNIYGNSYSVTPFSGGARCNPVNSASNCSIGQ
ncbi:Ca2+-dependent phosphoinositide-specific phospholipase C [Pseudohalioglobus lutimaris]|uniref:Calcium-dependent phosphoinositide phospholipase C n=1 Tax=Pseudohalioglobus lutimaris TaxID=1737061 RepID=A0A2N5WY95_9GAMM|nr:Ca2+-dependent phosphoinositide-specific phospholipase C [Pseudohalioglobus lutimaris]PLW67215.1 hypothetical protein C0039_17950 [Pseudohalioglobus lutimaris]